MQNIVPRRYSNLVILGLGLATIAALGVIYWLYYSKKEDTVKKIQPRQNPSIPADQTETQVDKKPVLVLIHSEGCGHCTAMKPSWDSVSRALQNAGLVDALALERSQNPQEIEMAGAVTGFPDVRLYPEGFPSKNYIKYSGDRSEDSLMQFAYSTTDTGI
jgi:thiol-disulfide isomerase/thioredoxin